MIFDMEGLVIHKMISMSIRVSKEKLAKLKQATRI